MSNWNKIFKPIVVLCVICVVITGALAATNSVTAPIIAEATRLAQEQARQELLPEEVDLRRCAMAVGSEGRGLSAAVLAACDRTIRIPMDKSCESLNAASAASVLLWEAARGDL